jgi:hypothetical protein
MTPEAEYAEEQIRKIIPNISSDCLHDCGIAKCRLAITYESPFTKYPQHFIISENYETKDKMWCHCWELLQKDLARRLSE